MGWVREKLDRRKLEDLLRRDAAGDRIASGIPATADAAAKELEDYLTDLSDAVMPRRGRPSPQRTVFWWSGELTVLRKAYITTLRAHQRAGWKGFPPPRRFVGRTQGCEEGAASCYPDGPGGSVAFADRRGGK